MKVWRLSALGLAVCVHITQAAPDEGFLRGQRAYQRGDVVAAMSALREGARGGHAPSMTLLAFILDRSDFSEEAAALYRSAAEQGDAEAHAGLANFYLTGRGLAKDEKAAFAHFSKAADAGHALAIEVVANAHLKGPLAIWAAPEAALAAVQRAALRDHLPSVEALAAAYRSGAMGLTADAGLAAQWQTRAIEIRRQRSTSSARPKA